MESRFELKTFVFDTMLNHHLFQKFKLIGKNKFNHLINSFTLHLMSLKEKVVTCLLENSYTACYHCWGDTWFVSFYLKYINIHI